MKVIIFGSNGQDGFYLKKHLLQLNISVVTSSRTNADFIGDVSDYVFVSNLIKDIKPDYVFHFAAVSSIDHDYIFANHETITTGTINILESCRLFSGTTKVFLAGSALQFKNNNNPITEFDEFNFSNVYSISRVHSIIFGRYYREKFGLKVYIGYLFNHDSPLRSDRHINQKIINAVKRIGNGSNEKIKIGNLKVKKEFSFAGDIVKAIWILVNQNEIFEVTIGSGISYSIEDWIKIAFRKINVSYENCIELNKDYINEYEQLVSNPKTIFKLGWKPEYDFFKLFELMWSSSE